MKASSKIIKKVLYTVCLFLCINDAFAVYATANLVTKSHYPSTIQVNSYENFTTPGFSVEVGGQKAFNIVVPPGTAYVDTQISSNTMEYGVRVGNSIENLATGVSPTLIIYQQLVGEPLPTVESSGAIYVDNSSGSKAFSGVANLTFYVVDLSLYTNWKSNTDLNPPTAPAGLVSSNVSKTAATLTWQDASDNETGFKLYRNNTVVNALGANATTQTHTDLTAGTSYDYKVCAYNNDGETCSNTISVTTTALQAPAAPTGLVSSNISKTGATLTWQDASDNETGFKLYRNNTVVNALGANATTQTHTDLTAGTSYDYKVCAYNGDGETCSNTISLTTTALQAPTAPSDLGATNLTKSTLTLNWLDKSSNELGFKLYRNNVAIGGDLNADISTYDDSDLTAGGTYTYRVCAFNDDGESCSANYDITLPTVQVPIKPSGLTASEFTEDGMKLSWVDNSSNELGFKLYRRGELASALPIGALSHVDTDLSSGTSYGYVVCAYNDDGEACSDYVWGSTLNLAAPDTLRSLEGSRTKTSLTLEWNDNSSYETGYILKENGIQVGVAYAPDTITAVRTGLISGQAYAYQVCAIDADSNESCSDVITDTTLSLGKPEQLIASDVTKDTIKLSWIDKTNDELGYKVKRNGIEIWVSGIVQPINSQGDYIDSGLNDNSAFLYQVCAYDDIDESCTELAVITLKSESPTALWADTTVNTITLNWTDNTGGTLNHRIKRGSMILVDNIAAGTYTGIPDTGLATGTELNYEVCAYSGSEEYCSSTFYAKTAEILVPTIQGFDDTDKNVISLTWADNSTNETHFQIKRAGASDFVNNLTFIDKVVSGETTFDDSGLEPDTAYVYQVCAIDNTDPDNVKEGCSALYFDAKTRALVLPEAPANPTVFPLLATPTSIKVEWVQEIGSGDFEVTGYRIEHGPASQPLLDDIDLGVLAETSYTDTGLEPSTQYEYKICAVNTDGETCATTFETSTDSLPAIPDGLMISAIEKTGLVLSWNDKANNEKGYQIIQKWVTGDGNVAIRSLNALLENEITSTVIDLDVSTEYQFKVCATYEGYVSSFDGATCSAVVSTTTKPDAPSGLTATSLAQTTVTLNWTDNNSNKSGYKVKRGVNVNDIVNDIASLDAGTITYTYTDNAIYHSRTYYYEICAYTEGGESCAAPFTVETYPAEPEITDTDISPSQTSVLFTWTDIAANESAYSVKRGGSVMGSLAANTQTYTDSSVSHSTLYVYEICAVDANNATTGFGGGSVEACTSELYVRTPIPVPVAPSVFATAADPAKTSVSFTWVDNSGDEDGFYLYRDGEQVGSVGAGVTTIDDEGLRSGTEYIYKVCAYNSGGEACSADLVLTTDGTKFSMAPIYDLLF